MATIDDCTIDYYILQGVKSDLYAHAKENKTQKRGTTDWHLMEGSSKDKYGPIYMKHHLPTVSSICKLKNDNT